MFKRIIKNQKGFTLVELLAVIVILGIILAIAVPAIGNVIENSKEDAKLANEDLIESAARLAHVSGVELETKTNGTDKGYRLITLVEEGYLEEVPEGYTHNSFVKATIDDNKTTFELE